MTLTASPMPTFEIMIAQAYNYTPAVEILLSEPLPIAPSAVRTNSSSGSSASSGDSVGTSGTSSANPDEEYMMLKQREYNERIYRWTQNMWRDVTKDIERRSSQ